MSDTVFGSPSSGAVAVSFPGEELVLVDGEDHETGYALKADVHRGAGQRHRAFSVFLFDEQQRLLVHRRSAHKPLWPGFWTNSCCSHPRRGEALESAVQRRLREELSCRATELQHVFRFEYHAPFGDVGSEHELCHVYLARAADTASVKGHALEIAELRWIPCDAVDVLMRTRPAELTPWFRQEWELLRGPHRDALQAFLDRQGSSPARSVA